MGKLYIIDTTDYWGRRVVFTKKKYTQKLIIHPWLKKRQFMVCLEKTLEEPDQVWEDYNAPSEKHCYYRKYSTGLYIKVVVWMNVRRSEPCHVVSAFETDYIKETKYPSLKVIYTKQ